MKNKINTLFLIIFITSTFTVGCQSFKDEISPNGKNQTSGFRLDLPGKIFDINIFSATQRIKSREEIAEDLEKEMERNRAEMNFDIEKRKKELSIKSDERRNLMFLILSGICFAGSIACAVLGYIFKGWKFWGGLAFIGIMGGTVFLTLLKIMTVLVWIVAVFLGLIIIKFLHHFKDKEAEFVKRGRENNDEGDK